MTVSEVWARHHELDGKPIRVSGYVQHCYALGCRLNETSERDSKHLSIGSSQAFDRQIQSHLGRRVTVEGRFDAKCLHVFADKAPERPEAPIVVCTDRASMIKEPRLVAVIR